MADYKVTDTQLTSIANAIRTKGGTSSPLEFPSEFVSAVNDIQNSYSQSDEGKVVSNGVLVAQGSDTVTENDTYDTTLISSLTVNVEGGGDLYLDFPFPTRTWQQNSRIAGLQQITGDRSSDLNCRLLNLNQDDNKPRISFGSSGSFNCVYISGAYFTHGKETLKVKYLPLLIGSSSYYTSNIWISNSDAYSNYTPTGTIIGEVNLGGEGHGVSDYQAVYGNTFLTDVQSNAYHAAWQIASIDVSNYDKFYIFFRACDMDSLIHSMWLE